MPRGLVRGPAPAPILEEGQRPGDPGWRFGRMARDGQVELSTSGESVGAGDTVAVRVVTDVPCRMSVEVYRLGYYGGAGARRVWRGGPIGIHRSSCPEGPLFSPADCRWSGTLAFTVGADWVPGLYLVKVIRPDGLKRFAPLVIHERGAVAPRTKPAFEAYQAGPAWHPGASRRSGLGRDG